MDELTTAERVKKLRQEISQIGAPMQAYRESGFVPRCAFDTNMYEQRRQRLREIKEELAAMLRRSAA